MSNLFDLQGMSGIRENLRPLDYSSDEDDKRDGSRERETIRKWSINNMRPFLDFFRRNHNGHSMMEVLGNGDSSDEYYSKKNSPVRDPLDDPDNWE